MPSTKVDHTNKQGGKQWGKLKKDQEEALEAINEEIIKNGEYSSYEDLEERLNNYKEKFIEYDLDNSGDLDDKDVTFMMEKLGQPKNLLEVKKMIAEVDTNRSGTINYNEFIEMMLGKKNSVLKIILMFEEKKKGKEQPTGIPPKRSLEDLP
ncbi:allograft inflammatory factor 1-like [Acanthaster planci]|uniref:Allograft inflammatory factor 1-like n=1 Tax=Acanthaster planci TaxID=133434 RepID=A0A8B7XZ96_ACAPL|nr:allograft inflammatory factor 1-like [Acanthaster planci]